MKSNKEELLIEDKPIDTSTWSKEDIINHNKTIVKLTKMSEELLKLVMNGKSDGKNI